MYEIFAKFLDLKNIKKSIFIFLFSTFKDTHIEIDLIAFLINQYNI